ncbi:hypothetical protein JTB14_008557 [Gonioctena quinquepunctata]|nr:hypothetical protein JTB14_008557 [Gonioctena quinquepunctata]
MITLVKLVKTAVYYGFYYSFKIGQFLVTLASLLLGYLIILIGILNDVLSILSESLKIFLEDFLRGLKLFLELSSHSFKATEDCIATTWQGIHNATEKFTGAVHSTRDVLCESFYNVFATIEGVLVFCKRSIVLFGSGMWFAVTFIPFTIWNVFAGIDKFFEDLHRGAFDLTKASAQYLKNAFIFLIDIPVEAAVGLLVAASLVFIFTQFYVIIFSYLYRQGRIILFNIYRKFRRRRLQVQNRQIPYRNVGFTPRKRPQLRNELNLPQSPKEGRTDEKYCVICQEHLKCILLLPCRHVCMCSECYSRLQLYSNSCPICRNDIENTMKIFF